MVIKEYLLERKQILENIIREEKEKYEHNQISIVELNNQIKEMKNDVDEALQIFSVKAREDNNFKQQEIEEIESKIAVCVSSNMDCKKMLDEKEKELTKVILSLEELEDVSCETFEETQKLENLGNYIKEVFAEDNKRDDSEDECKELKGDVFEKDSSIKTEQKFNSEIKKQIKDKVLLCKKIASVDEQRVIIELDNILRLLD